MLAEIFKTRRTLQHIHVKDPFIQQQLRKQLAQAELEQKHVDMVLLLPTQMIAILVASAGLCAGLSPVLFTVGRKHGMAYQLDKMNTEKASLEKELKKLSKAGTEPQSGNENSSPTPPLDPHNEYYQRHQADAKAAAEYMEKYDSTALIRASTDGRFGVVRALLQREDIDVNVQNENGETALMLASSKGHEAIVKALLERENIAVNVQNRKNVTALITASSNGHTGVVRQLLASPKTADGIGLKDENNKTAYDWAVANEHEDIVNAFKVLPSATPRAGPSASRKKNKRGPVVNLTITKMPQSSDVFPGDFQSGGYTDPSFEHVKQYSDPNDFHRYMGRATTCTMVGFDVMKKVLDYAKQHDATAEVLAHELATVMKDWAKESFATNLAEDKNFFGGDLQYQTGRKQAGGGEYAMPFVDVERFLNDHAPESFGCDSNDDLTCLDEVRTVMWLMQVIVQTRRELSFKNRKKDEVHHHKGTLITPSTLMHDDVTNLVVNRHSFLVPPIRAWYTRNLQQMPENLDYKLTTKSQTLEQGNERLMTLRRIYQSKTDLIATIVEGARDRLLRAQEVLNMYPGRAIAENAYGSTAK